MRLAINFLLSRDGQRRAVDEKIATMKELQNDLIRFVCVYLMKIIYVLFIF